jgi:hypothetical protein
MDGRCCWCSAHGIFSARWTGASYAAFPDQGIFKSDLNGNQWQMLGGGLPTSPVFRIALTPQLTVGQIFSIVVDPTFQTKARKR